MPSVSWFKPKSKNYLYHELQELVVKSVKRLRILDKDEYITNSKGTFEGINFVAIYKLFKKLLLNNEFLGKQLCLEREQRE